jgi:hypothetical protein
LFSSSELLLSLELLGAVVVFVGKVGGGFFMSIRPKQGNQAPQSTAGMSGNVKTGTAGDGLLGSSSEEEEDEECWSCGMGSSVSLGIGDGEVAGRLGAGGGVWRENFSGEVLSER